MFKMKIPFFSALIILALIPLVPSILSDPLNQPIGDYTIPAWVKGTAGWWSEDKIPDSSFIETIEFLIKDEIITVGIPDLDSEVVNEIPFWVKNTAGWWSEDKIPDVTFIAAIKYLMSQGIIHIEREQVEESEKCTFKGFEVACPDVMYTEEVKEFHMVVNGGNCCLNWAHVGEEYRFQIETFDEFRGSPIDGVTITAKIISNGGELRYDFGRIITEDGIYKSGITIPNIDWYAENILSVTAEYNGIEKTIEKEFDVFRKSITSSGSVPASAGSCARVSPVSLANETEDPTGIAFSKNGQKMFVMERGNDTVLEYTLTGGTYCIATASFVDSYSVVNSGAEERNPQDITFSKYGTKMFIIGSTDNNKAKVSEYTLPAAWDISTAIYVDSLSVNSCGADCSAARGLAFSESGMKMFVMVAKTVDAVDEYTLGTAWDVSTASYVDSKDVQSENSEPTGLAFSKNGDKMFVVGKNGSDDRVYEYTLGTDWDVSTASYVDNKGVASQDANPQGIWFDYAGETMFMVGDQGNDVNVYTLSTAWDISTAKFVD